MRYSHNLLSCNTQITMQVVACKQIFTDIHPLYHDMGNNGERHRRRSGIDASTCFFAINVKVDIGIVNSKPVSRLSF
jgi:hypothetical protein